MLIINGKDPAGVASRRGGKEDLIWVVLKANNFVDDDI